MHNRARRAEAGFTLFEILVALVLFTILMGSAYQLFNTLVDNGTRLTERGREDEQQAQAWLIIAQDLYHLRERTWRDALGGLQPAVELNEAGELHFVRGGLPPLMGVTPGGLQRVSYRLQDQQLQRLAWPVLDLDPASEPDVQPLLTGVEALSIRLLDESNLWRTLWPYQTDGSDTSAPQGLKMPRMLDIALTLNDGTRVHRSFVGLGQ